MAMLTNSSCGLWSYVSECAGAKPAILAIFPPYSEVHILAFEPEISSFLTQLHCFLSFVSSKSGQVIETDAFGSLRGHCSLLLSLSSTCLHYWQLVSRGTDVERYVSTRRWAISGLHLIKTYKHASSRVSLQSGHSIKLVNPTDEPQATYPPPWQKAAWGSQNKMLNVSSLDP